MERTEDRDRTGADDGDREDRNKPRPKRLDLQKLDLTVEEVEERIRPGETNVFDK